MQIWGRGEGDACFSPSLHPFSDRWRHCALLGCTIAVERQPINNLISAMTVIEAGAAKGGLPIRLKDNVFAQTVVTRHLYTSFLANIC